MGWIVTCSDFFAYLFQVLDAFIHTLKSGLELQGWFKGWLKAVPDFERRFVGTTVRAGVVCKFNDGEECSPIVLLKVSTNSEVLLDYLVNLF